MRRDAKTLSPFVMLITVLSVGLQDISAGAVSPAISAICQSYPSVSIGMIQMIVTLPTLAICIMAPVYGWLSNRIQPRRLIINILLCFDQNIRPCRGVVRRNDICLHTHDELVAHD